jgi:molybdate transport system substrate-binding protein
MSRTLGIIGMVALLAGLAGCTANKPAATGGPATATSGAVQQVMIYVPCGMIIPVRTVMDAFEKKNPGIKVRGVFDNSDIIVDRVSKRHEKPDLVMSPGNVEMDQLKAAGFLNADGAKVLGNFELVVMVPAASTLVIKSPADLKQCQTIVSPDPSNNSIGASGKEALTKLGLWDTLKSKMVFTKHAIESHTIVAQGKADAGIAYRNCPLQTNPEKLNKSKVHIGFSFPADSYVRQPCLIARLKTSTSPAAGKFFAFINSPAGLKILADKGLTGPSAADRAATGGKAAKTK